MYSTILLFLKVCMCLEKCDKNGREEEDWRGKSVGRCRFLFYMGLFSFFKQTGVCLISGAEESPKFLPHQWAFGLGKDEACWPGVCPGSDRVLCHSSYGPGPGRQHSGVQDL